MRVNRLRLCFSPSGVKVRTKRQLMRFLGDLIDPAGFDFRTGLYNPVLLRKNRRHRSSSSGDTSRGLRCGDISVSAPLRRTASIFKQPVTLVKSQPESITRRDLKHGPNEKPRQLFWEKRLEGLKATMINHKNDDGIELPKNLQPVGPNVSSDTALRSLTTALHLHSGPILGQAAGRNIEKNAAVYLDPDQPLIGTVVISDEDIRRQEERVYHARRKLAEAINDYELG